MNEEYEKQLAALTQELLDAFAVKLSFHNWKDLRQHVGWAYPYQDVERIAHLAATRIMEERKDYAELLKRYALGSGELIDRAKHETASAIFAELDNAKYGDMGDYMTTIPNEAYEEIKAKHLGTNPFSAEKAFTEKAKGTNKEGEG